jgi:hypothetical protein
MKYRLRAARLLVKLYLARYCPWLPNEFTPTDMVRMFGENWRDETDTYRPGIDTRQ